MKKVLISAFALALPFVSVAAGGLYGDVPDSKHAWAVHDWHRPKPHRVTPAKELGGAPSDAVVLFDGTKASFEKNWCNSKGEPTQWAYSDEGFFYCKPNYKNGGDIFTRNKFGDCQLHLEYRHDPKAIRSDWGPQMRGNSGVFIMNNYEIQVLESYHTSREDTSVDNYTDGQAGSVYAENPPLVNPQRKCGEWQVYDIVFHQPVWDGEKLLHPGSVTVFFNGVLVQDHWEMEGLTTHCRRRPLAPHARALPLKLQDHGCMVQFRNVWYRPLASRWDNTTHSSMSGKEEDVIKLRRETASKLFAKIANPAEVSATNLKKLAEVIGYVNEEPYSKAFRACLNAYKAKPHSEGEIKDVNRSLGVLVRCKVIGKEDLVK